MSECKERTWTGKLRCNFEPRYSTTTPSVGINGINNLKPAQLAAIAPSTFCTNKIYVRDVCTACGKTIERQK